MRKIFKIEKIDDEVGMDLLYIPEKTGSHLGAEEDLNLENAERFLSDQMS